MLTTSADALEIAAQQLAEKGWCLVDIPHSGGDDSLKADVDSLEGFTSLPQEVTNEYLGRGGRGKVIVLDDLFALSEHHSVLASHVGVLNNMALVITGSYSGDFIAPMLYMPYAGPAEAKRLKSRSLTEDEIEAGLIATHIEFVRRRKLCFLYYVAGGSDLCLHPRDGFGLTETQVRLVKGGMLIFRCDLMTFSRVYESDDSVVLQSWVLGALPRQEQWSLSRVGTSSEVEELDAATMEILRGPSVPLGERVHIMAIACRVNGGIDAHKHVWNASLGGVDGFIEFPLARFDAEIYCTKDGEKVDGKSYVRHAGLLETAILLQFDNEFFGYTPEDARNMPPVQRNILEVGYEGLHQAGYTKASLEGKYIGHYVGDTAAAWDFLFTVPMVFPVDWKDGRYGHSSGVTASRLSYVLGLRGPNCQVDTACSAALVGVTMAVNTMRMASSDQGRVTIGKPMREALCMGCNHFTNPMGFVALCGPEMLAADGRCFTFDQSASGYARGEAIDAMMLRCSNDDKDRSEQLACLVGAHANQDGRSATLTAPNGPAQQMAIRASMHEAGLTTQDTTISECHGTGTALGDPIEVGAVRGVLGRGRVQSLYLGSSKTNVGHTEAAAGLTGLCKCVENLCCGTAPPNIHLRRFNPHIDVEGFPAYFVTEASDVRLDSGLCGVSSFGFGGTNARGDVWGESAHSYGQRLLPTRRPKSSLQSQAVVCPFTLAPIDSLSGELYNEDVVPEALRDEFAAYDISEYAYSGDYRYRRQAAENDRDMSNGAVVCICSSASGWKAMEPMVKGSDGWYRGTIVLGQAKQELFFLSVRGNKKQAFFPAVKTATSPIWVLGPEENADNHCWACDARDDTSLPPGTTFQVSFRWGSLRKQVTWEVVPDIGEPTEESYGITGTLTGDTMQSMTAVVGRPNTWQHVFRIGLSGQEEFRFARNGDEAQMFYPASKRATSSTVPVRGPDELCHGRAWLVEGQRGEKVVIKLEVVDGKVDIEVSPATSGTFRFGNRLRSTCEYYVYGSFSNDPVHMVLAGPPGRFQATVRLREEMEAGRFWIILDMDPEVGIFPGLPDADSAESIAYGPQLRSGSSKSWLIRNELGGALVDICLDLTASDRRRTVTWSFRQ